MARPRRLIVAAAVSVALVGLAALVAALAPLPSGRREQTYVIPRGTAARREAGEAVSPLPLRLRFTVGVRDVLVLRNDDVVGQSFGPVRLAPGQTYRVPFRTPAEFQLSCSAHASGQVTVSVEPAPAAGWARLRWRILGLLD